MKKNKFVFEWSMKAFSPRPAYSIAANTVEEAIKKVAECRDITVPTTRRMLAKFDLSVYDLDAETRK